MPVKKSAESVIYTKVKGIIKSLNLDQQTLASQLGVHQTMVSNALNGKNEKTFQRLVALLEKEHGVNVEDAPRPLADESDIQLIKEELNSLQGKMGEVLKGIEELKEMMKK